MKKLLLIIGVAFYTATFAQQPQNPEKRSERVEAMRVAFITKRLNLSPEEAQRFWPVYNKFRADLKTLRKNYRQSEQDGEPLTADERLEFEQKKLDLKKNYKPQFEEVVGKEKFNLLMNAEEDFKRELVQIMRERRENGPPQNRPRRY